MPSHSTKLPYHVIQRHQLFRLSIWGDPDFEGILRAEKTFDLKAVSESVRAIHKTDTVAQHWMRVKQNLIDGGNAVVVPLKDFAHEGVSFDDVDRLHVSNFRK